MGSHFWDLIPVVLLGLLIFGPKRLPEMGASIGKTIKSFQHSMREVTAEPESQPALPAANASVVAPSLPAAPTAPTAEALATDAQATEAVGAESAS